MRRQGGGLADRRLEGAGISARQRRLGQREFARRDGPAATDALEFGQGVIVASEGAGNEARLQVNFGRQGMKWLALAYAKLQPL